MNTTPAFTLWLEFEHGYPSAHDDVTDDYCNLSITLPDGRGYALNVWTYMALDTIRHDAIQTGENLAGRYLHAPDLFVERLDRNLLEAVVADMIANDALKETWRVVLPSG